MFIEIDAPQRSEEWRAARLGCLCASDAKDMLASVKTGEAAARRDLRLQLVCERLTGKSADDVFVNADMERGITLEPHARIAYEFQAGVSVREVGFLRHADAMAGCSPDGVIGDVAGLVELKAPRTARHVSYLREGGIPPEHRAQLLHQLWISGAGYVDFASFDPTLPERLQLFVARLVRVEKDIADYEKKALAFLAECDRDLAALMTMADVGAQLAASLEA